MVLLVWGLGFTVSYFHVSGSADSACTEGFRHAKTWFSFRVSKLVNPDDTVPLLLKRQLKRHQALELLNPSTASANHSYSC